MVLLVTVAILAPFLLVFWPVLAAVLVPRLSFALDRPDGFPADAIATYDFKFGTSWQYCRNLPSGRAISTQRGLILENEARCDDPVQITYEAPTSLDRPGMRLFESGNIAFSVPPSQGTRWDSPCPFRFDETYLHRARTLVAQALRERDLYQQLGRNLRAAEASLAAYSASRLKVGGASGETYFCTLEPSAAP
jgi:hypothetical protein